MGPKINGLVEYWHARCRNGCLPGRRMIDPADLKPPLPSMILIDCATRDDHEWAYRLVGTEIVYHDGYDRTGRSVRDYYTGSAWPLLRAEHLMCMDEHRSAYRADIAYDSISGDSFEFERIFLPLAEDGRNVDKLIGKIAYLRCGTLERQLTA